MSEIEENKAADKELNGQQLAFCSSLTNLFWWKKPEEVAQEPERALAGIMDRGSIREWRDMERLFPRQMIIRALDTARCGEFHNWSWTFWHLRYGLGENAPLFSCSPFHPAPSGEAWYRALQKKEKPKDPHDPATRLAWTEKLRSSAKKS